MSSAPIRVLLVEDSINDTFLIIRELQRGGLEVEFERVESADYLVSALSQKSWDLVICDYWLPQFDGLQALSLFRQKQLDIPFIMISGMPGEDHAQAMLKAGAHDYISKDNLGRLTPAVRRELSNAEARRQRAALPDSVRRPGSVLTETNQLQSAVLGEISSPSASQDRLTPDA